MTVCLSGRRHLAELERPLLDLRRDAPRLERWGRQLAGVLMRRRPAAHCRQRRLGRRGAAPRRRAGRPLPRRARPALGDRAVRGVRGGHGDRQRLRRRGDVRAPGARARAARRRADRALHLGPLAQRAGRRRRGGRDRHGHVGAHGRAGQPARAARRRLPRGRLAAHGDRAGDPPDRDPPAVRGGRRVARRARPRLPLRPGGGGMSTLVVIGDALLDRDLDGRAERLAPDAPVPVVDAVERHDRAGGAGLAAALAAAAGHAVTLVCALGDDAAGARVRELLADAGVAVCDLGLRGRDAGEGARARRRPRARAARLGRRGARLRSAHRRGARGARGRRRRARLRLRPRRRRRADRARRARRASARRRSSGIRTRTAPSPCAGCLLVTPNAAEAERAEPGGSPARPRLPARAPRGARPRAARALGRRQRLRHARRGRGGARRRAAARLSRCRRRASAPATRAAPATASPRPPPGGSPPARCRRRPCGPPSRPPRRSSPAGGASRSGRRPRAAPRGERRLRSSPRACATGAARSSRPAAASTCCTPATSARSRRPARSATAWSCA